MPERVIVIGLDAADPDLVEGWVREGHLPVIASLMENGAWGRLASPAEISTGPAWPMFFAGTGPAPSSAVTSTRKSWILAARSLPLGSRSDSKGGFLEVF